MKTDLLYTTKALKEEFNLSNYDILQIRKKNRAPYQQLNNGRYVYEINEELAKDFINIKPVKKSLSTTSDEDNVERTLTDDAQIDFPELYGYYNIKQQKKMSALQQRDHLIQAYRNASLKSKVSSSIEEIINEMLTPFDSGEIVKIEIDKDNGNAIGTSTEKDVLDAYDKFLEKIDFVNEADNLATEWYVDGSLDIECIYDNSKISEGIQATLKLSPIFLREIVDKDTKKKSYIYEKNLVTLNSFLKNDIKEVYKEEQLIHVGSGKWDADKIYQISYLRLALKAINDLAHIENSIIKYRITRASERNIWNIDVGNMPKNKAETHLANLARVISSNVKYNTDTGETSLENTEGITSDWMFPSRNGKQKTDVSTINGDTNFISKLEDLQYFRRELYEAMKIPIGRLDGDSSLDYSAMDILREELKFTKFISRLRRKFSELFYEGIKRELIATAKMTVEEWNEAKKFISFKWNESNQIVENGKLENLKIRIDTVNELKSSGLLGTVLSWDYVLKNILNMTDEEITEQKDLIKKEVESGMHSDDEEDNNI